MISKLLRIALVPAVVLPSFLCLAFLSGCGDDGSPKPMALTEENKANIAAEQAAAEQAENAKPAKGQP